MHILHEIIEIGTDVAVVLFELLALVLLVINGIKGLIALSKHDENVSLILLKGFSEGLTFLLGAEILKTIILEDASGLIVVAGVTGIRVILSILIHWEMSLEQKEKEMEHQAQKIELATQMIDKKKKELENEE